MATKGQEIYEEINRRIDSGIEKADAFKALAEEASRPYDSIRGSYYSYKKKIEGGESRPRSRKRETTPADAVKQATGTLRKAIEAIDREVEIAKERATEAAAEAKALAASAAERKAEIERKIAALES